MRVVQIDPQAVSITLPRQRMLLLLTLLAVGCFCLSAVFFRPFTNRAFIGWAALTFVLGVLALGGALWLQRERLASFVPERAAPLPERTRWGTVGFGLLLIALGSASSIRALDPVLFIRMSIHLQFALLLAGTLLAGWGLGGPISVTLRHVQRFDAIALLGIVLLGAFVRLWGLETNARFYMDENVFADAILGLMQNREPTLLIGNGRATITALFLYWNAGTVSLFGYTLTGLRMASVIGGILAIPVMYEVMKLLFNRRLGLISALLLATFPVHIHFSMISWGHMWDPLFGLMSIMFFLRAMRWNRAPDWAFAGISLGMTQHFYEVGRLFYPPLVVVWLLILIVLWGRRRSWRGLLLALAGFLVVAVPVYAALLGSNASLTPRVSDSVMPLSYWRDLFADGLTAEEQRIVGDRIVTPFLVYTHQWDGRAEYYGGFAGIVPPVLVPLFLLGAAWTFWNLYKPANLPLLALVLISTAAILANSGAFYPRFAAFLPMVVMLLAVGIYSLLHLLGLNQRPWVAAGVALLVAAAQGVYYYAVHLPYFNEQRRSADNELDFYDAILRVPDLPPGTQPLLIERGPAMDFGRANSLYLYVTHAQTNPYPLLPFFNADIDLAALPRDRNYAFFVGREDVETQARIYAAFPDAQPPSPTTYPVPEWDQYTLILWLTPTPAPAPG